MCAESETQTLLLVKYLSSDYSFFLMLGILFNLILIFSLHFLFLFPQCKNVKIHFSDIKHLLLVNSSVKTGAVVDYRPCVRFCPLSSSVNKGPQINLKKSFSVHKIILSTRDVPIKHFSVQVLTFGFSLIERTWMEPRTSTPEVRKSPPYLVFPFQKSPELNVLFMFSPCVAAMRKVRHKKIQVA